MEASIFYKCIIQHNSDEVYDEKYIICKSVDSQKQSKGYYLVSYPLGYHSQIFSKFQSENRENLVVEGGGIIVVDVKKQLVKTFGQSGSYGKPKADLLERLIKSHPTFASYTFDLKITNEIRG